MKDQLLTAILDYITADVMATSAVAESRQTLFASLALVADRPLALSLESAAETCIDEALRAAFLAGVAFDARALLLDAAQ